MWTVAVVDRLVCRNNTALTSVLAAAQIFVEGWTAFAAALMRKAAHNKLASEGDKMNSYVYTSMFQRDSGIVYLAQFFIIQPSVIK
jgi:hypothetical protein